MSTFLEDPRLRQRWNQISHTTETVTENAAAGIWTFQHNYINPCLSSLSDAVEPCIAPCFGDRDERARWARAREHHQQYTRAEYTFDFYDDWDDDDELLANSRRGGYYGGGGDEAAAPGGNSRGEDWDRLIGGSGAAAASRKGNTAGEIGDQPRRKRGMSYGTRGGGGGGGSGAKRNSKSDEDLTIIPSTAPLGFLSRLPWKIGGTLRYKPSAAFLQDHPGGGAGSNQQHYAAADENQPLLDSSDGDQDDFGGLRHVIKQQQPRKRSSTGGSGDTSDSFRSRGDLFPSDGEEYDDAMEIDDEFAVALERVDDRASSKTTPSSKGKRPAGSSRRLSRTISGTTISTRTSKSPLRGGAASTNLQTRRSSVEPSVNTTLADDSTQSLANTPSIEDLQREEEEVQRQEDEEIVRKREAAGQLARERGLSAASENNRYDSGASESRAAKSAAMFRVDEVTEPRSPDPTLAQQQQQQPTTEGGGVHDALHFKHVQNDVQGDEDVVSKAVEQQWHCRGDTTEAASRREDNDDDNNDESHQRQRRRPPPTEDDFIPARLPNFQ